MWAWQILISLAMQKEEDDKKKRAAVCCGSGSSHCTILLTSQRISQQQQQQQQKKEKLALYNEKNFHFNFRFLLKSSAYKILKVRECIFKKKYRKKYTNCRGKKKMKKKSFNVNEKDTHIIKNVTRCRRK